MKNIIIIGVILLVLVGLAVMFAVDTEQRRGLCRSKEGVPLTGRGQYYRCLKGELIDVGGKGK